jgi:hypothetical protein
VKRVIILLLVCVVVAALSLGGFAFLWIREDLRERAHGGAPAEMAAKRRQSEVAAVLYLRKIAAAQEAFFAEDPDGDGPDYGGAKELLDSQPLLAQRQFPTHPPPRLRRNKKKKKNKREAVDYWGYVFFVEAEANPPGKRWLAVARPLVRGLTGDASFAITQDGVVYESAQRLELTEDLAIPPGCTPRKAPPAAGPPGPEEPR